jgi:hypothetical protein
MSVVETPARPAMDSFAIRWIGYGLALLGTALALAIMFVGQGPAQALTLASVIVQVGLLVLIERVPQAFMVMTRYGQRTINFVMVIPVVALAVAGTGALFLQPEIAAMVALGAAAVGLLVAVWMPRPVKVANPVIFGLFVACYGGGLGWGAMALVNRVFDSSTVQVFPTVVQDRRETWGGRGGPHHYLVLEPWGPVNRTTTIGVSGALYYQASIGAPLCARLHAGALGVAWYQIGSC